MVYKIKRISNSFFILLFMAFEASILNLLPFGISIPA
jgi:hypothetical protein